MTTSVARKERLVTLVLRPSSPPVACGIVLAAALVLIEIVVVLMLKRIAPENAFGAVFLFGVLVVSAGWGFRLSIATSIASAAAYAYIHVIESSESLVPAVVVFLALALLTNMLVGQSRLRAVESARQNRRATALARQQASLRRVATLVASRAEPDEVYAAVTDELAGGLGIEHVSVVHFDPVHFDPVHFDPVQARSGLDSSTPGTYVVLAGRDTTEGHRLTPGERLTLGGHNVCTAVAATGRPATIDFATATGDIVDRLDGRGIAVGLGVPINVDGRIWGAIVVGSTESSVEPDLQDRLTDFADLLATAVYNSETREELTRSRARVVAAADQARRSIERDLHDGAQQRIVSLGMELRTAQAVVPEDLRELRQSLDRSVDTLAQIHTDLRELSRGIHPAILSRGGLAPALKTLARRSPVPVELTTDIPVRLDDSIEVAAYYVVAESLTNTAKYADASHIRVTAVVTDGDLTLTVSDDGRGGADPALGSGLIGLQDRVAAAGGTLALNSPAGEGTSVTVTIATSTG
ncbi:MULTISPECIES: sensor histidine kinase [Nocardiaceae]|uniref:sensor histidine kinase n=1 Tax=Nocardiaceae TaxID=85025 RepID=UPI000565CAAE|nr:MULTISPECIES: GAF domain-containing sensor histidine kinase [Rhodococcus]OZF04755.1 histidine kinase [Rhodococcus sp. 15-1189-1-1a]OZF19020.1 histidine kinase [Rhodococcus sp. 14-2686-1-2]